MIQITELHVSITGDCSGLVAATKNAESAIDGLAGKGATVSVGLAGSSAVVSGLNAVGAARDRAGGTVSLGVDSSGIAGARGQLSGLRGDMRAAGREFDSLAGSRAFSLTDGGSIRQMTGDLGGATRQMAGFGRESQSALSGVEQSFAGIRQESAGASAGLGSFSLASSHVASSSELAASAGAKVEASLGNVQTLARAATADIQDMASAMSVGGGSLSGASNSVASSLGNANRAMVPGGGGPPPPRGGGGGGGGGGEGPPPGWTSEFDKLGGSSGGSKGAGIGGLGMSAMLGVVGGAVDEMIGAGAGLLSVNEAIKNTPGLARAANQAMGEFNKGVRSTAASALGEGVPALQKLGEALGPLGQEVGRIGAANMGTAINGITGLVGGATTALTNLAPAIGPALSGAINLGDALMAGIGNPQIAAAVKSVGESLQSANVASAITDATVGLLTAGGVVTQVAADATGVLGGLLNVLGPDAAQSASPTLTGAGIGGFTAGKMFGGGVKGGLIAAALGASAAGIGSWQQQQGQDPTAGIVGEVGGAALGMKAFGPAGALLGIPAQAAVAGLQNTSGSGAAGDMLAAVLGGAALGGMIGGPAGALVGGVGGAGVGLFQAIQDHANGTGGFTPGSISAGGSGSASSSVTPGRFGLSKDAQGNLTPSNTPSGGGGWYPGGPGTGGSGVQSTQPAGMATSPSAGMTFASSDGSIPSSMQAPAPSSPQVAGASQSGALGLFGSSAPKPPPPPPPSSPAATGGFGQGAPTAATAQALQQLSAALPAANSSLAQTAPSAASAASGLSRVAPAAQQTAQGLQQVSQSATQMAAPMAAVSQHAASATQAVQQMATQAPQAVQAVQAVAPAAHAALSQAGSAIQSGGQAMGAQMPAAVATGVQASTSQACDASNAMAKNAAACAAAALGTHSPSKVFTVLGLSTGQGLAIGITNSTGEAVSAVRASMGAVVDGAKGALQTASPSKAFTTMGSQAMGNVAGGANSYAPGSNARYPQADNARKDAEQQAKDAAALNDPKAKSDAAFQARMKQLGYSPATVAKLTADREREQAKTKAELDRKAHPERDKAHQVRKDDAQRKAMEASGFKVDPNNPDSPHNQRATKLDADRKILKANAKDLVNDGLTSKDPAAVQRRLTGLPGTAGNAQQQRSMNEQGKSIGDNLNKGMADGIKKGAGGPEDAAGKMSSNVIHKTKKTLGIKSPSSEFHDVGDNCMRGWADGVNGGRGRLDKEWDDIDHDMRDRWDKWGKFNPFPSDPGGGGGSSGGGSSGGGGGGGAAQSVGPGSGELVTSGRAARRVLRSDRGGYGLTGVGGDPHFSKPLPYDKDPSRLISANIRLKQERAYDARVNALLKGVDTALTGGFGSGVTAASNGVLGIASNTGLLVGTQWGRSVVTGADSVLKTADFTAAAVPQIGSALAKTALGTLGMLGPAGSGASLQNAPGVTMSAGTPAAPPVIHNHIYIDGKEIQSMTNQQIDTAIGNLADSISRQRG